MLLLRASHEMWEQLKTLLFRCDICNKEEIIDEVRGHRQPGGWGYKHPENSHSMFEKSLDLCPACMKAEKWKDDEQKRQETIKINSG